MNNGYLYMNYSHSNNCYLYVYYSRTNNCYSYVKLFQKNKKYQNIITAHAQSIHVRIEFTRRNTFNVRIATTFFKVSRLLIIENMVINCFVLLNVS